MTSPTYPTTGDALARLRLDLGLTQQEAAERVGMQQRRRNVLWSSWEGQDVLDERARLAGLALALGRRVEELEAVLAMLEER